MLFQAVSFFVLFHIGQSLCPNGSIEYKTNCFLFNTTRLAFARAEISCNTGGGHLVSIHDAFLNAVIGEYAPDYFTETDFWVGANKFISPENWTWTDGTSLNYNDWKMDEPKNVTGYDCVSVSVQDGYWSAQECFLTKPFVCDVSHIASSNVQTTSTVSSTQETSRTSATKSITSTKTTDHSSTTSTYHGCPSGWTHFEKSCYFFYNTTTYWQTWNESETYCNNLGAHSASIHSKEEADFFYNLGNPLVSSWIGLYSNDSGKTWKWTDSSSVDYLPWYGGQPTINSGLNCALLTVNPKDFFDTRACNNIYYTLCKKPLV